MFSYLTMKILRWLIELAYVAVLAFVWFTLVTFSPLLIFVGKRVYRIILTLKKGTSRL